MLDNKEYQALIAEYSSMGFDAHDIILAYLSCGQRKALVLDALLILTNEKKKLDGSWRTSVKAADGLSQSQILFERDMQKALKMSSDDNTKCIRPDELMRKNDEPVGLKNIGNTCYFNSLLQTLFQITGFHEEIFKFKEPKDINVILNKMGLSSDSNVRKRKLKSFELVIALKKQLALMCSGNKKILNPREVMTSIMDYQGTPVKIGEQSDVGEFSINLFERIEEGLAFSEEKVEKLIQDSKAANPSILLTDNKKIPDFFSGSKNDPKDLIAKASENLSALPPLSGFSEIFFGTSKDFVSFEWDKDNFKTKKNQESLFGPITLDIMHKDLLTSFDAYNNLCIEGYKSPNGEVTTAKKRSWIQKAPKIMTFILNRVYYDKVHGLQKNNDVFKFDKEIYLDRFLYENKKKLKNIFEMQKELKIKEKKLDQEIQKYKSYDKNNMSLSSVIETAKAFLETQLSELDKDFVEINSDSSDDKIEECSTAAEVRLVVTTLKKFQDKIGNKIKNLEERKESLKKKITEVFHDIKKVKYNLYSIVIHEGGANSGHYYALVYDRTTKKWTKYNDSIISTISEEDVMRLANGGSDSKCSAYCLFYVEEGANLMKGSKQLLQDIQAVIPKSTMNFVNAENAKFLVEYQHYNANIISKLYDDYINHMNVLSYETAKYQSDAKNYTVPSLPVLPSFNHYLLMDTPKCTEVTRWKVLSDVLNAHKIPYDILGGQKANFYYEDLKQLIVDNVSTYNIKSMELSESNEKLLNQKQKEYIDIVKCSIMIKKILQQINVKAWREAIVITTLLHEKVAELKKNEVTSNITEFARYLLNILSLKFCTLIDTLFLKNQSKEAIQYLEIVIHCINKKLTLKPSKTVSSQIAENLNHSANTTARKCLKEAELAIFAHYIRKLEDKCEVIPSIDTSTLIPLELLDEMAVIEASDDSCSPDFKINQGVNELFTASKTQLKLWIEFEDTLRKKNAVVPQDVRMEKEALTYINE